MLRALSFAHHKWESHGGFEAHQGTYPKKVVDYRMDDNHAQFLLMIWLER